MVDENPQSKIILIFNTFVLSVMCLQMNSQTVTDYDGNVYQTVTIGDQIWMAENLKTTKYNDGTSIPYISSNTEWANLSSPGMSIYNNDSLTYFSKSM